MEPTSPVAAITASAPFYEPKPAHLFGVYKNRRQKQNSRHSRKLHAGLEQDGYRSKFGSIVLWY